MCIENVDDYHEVNMKTKKYLIKILILETGSIKNVKQENLPLEKTLLIKSANLLEIACPNNPVRENKYSKSKSLKIWCLKCAEISELN